jgi:hypothetical protein
LKVSAPQQGYYPPVLPPDPEFLAQAYLTPFLTALPGFDAAVPVVTRLPSPEALQASLTGILRVEAGDTHWLKSLWGAAFDTSFLMHAYSPNEDQAAMISRTAIAHVAAATGLTIVGFYVVDVCNVIGGRRLDDPDVPENVVRYRSAVTWRVAGHPLT